jgi:DNA-binding MarR family transcriptional regulator
MARRSTTQVLDPKTSLEVPDRAELPGYVVNLAARLFGRAFNRRLALVGATTGQWPILLALLEDDRLTQSELVRRLDLEQPTVANTIKRMHRDDLVARAPHPTDRRQELLYLTDRGRALAPQMVNMAAEVNRAALAGLSPSEARTLLALLHRVIDNLRADTAQHHVDVAVPTRHPRAAPVAQGSRRRTRTPRR